VLLEPGRLQIDVLADTHAALLRLTGELEATTARDLVADAERLVLQGHRHLILDCVGVTFCDSYGLRALTVLADRLQPDGSVTLARPSGGLLELLAIVGVKDRFEIAGARGDVRQN
jgi:anti-sigma B factor antagonist